MPEMTFTIRWPDGSVDTCYSPSLVMWDHLAPAGEYTVEDFTARATTALDAAAVRVQARYGFACTSAMEQRDEIRRRATDFDGASPVRVLAMAPPLPEAAEPAARQQVGR